MATGGSSAAPAGRPAPWLPPGALDPVDFVRIAENGFGDGLNSYAHSMAWFRGHLYVGTSRGTLAMVRANQPPPAFTAWPIKTPGNVYDLDRRAQIWRYSPDEDRWELAFISPMITGRTGETVARDIGYRGMSVGQAADDPEPALYVCTWSSSKGLAPGIMRSRDGVTFEDLPAPFARDPSINTFRTLEFFKGRFYTTPTGRTAGYGLAAECVAEVPVVYTTETPSGGDWVEASTPGFGDRGNLTIFEMTQFNGCLYAATLNPEHGFQIWKTRGEGPPPHEWTLVVADGAGRGNLNEAAASLCPFKDALYVGTGVVNGGYDRTRRVGPAASELIRIHPDDSWDLVVGAPRQTPTGFKHPISGLGPGFDRLFNGYFWRMAVHDGWLYLGTYNWAVLLPFLPLDAWPEAGKELFEWVGLDNLVANDGGFDLWRTWDGVDWTCVTGNGFDNQYNWGIRTMVSTAHGLFVGTANPFGPEVAVRTAEGWTYEPNPRGGLEVWLGRSTAGPGGIPSGVAARTNHRRNA